MLGANELRGDKDDNEGDRRAFQQVSSRFLPGNSVNRSTNQVL
jgi:hypothetical protein